MPTSYRWLCPPATDLQLVWGQGVVPPTFCPYHPSQTVLFQLCPSSCHSGSSLHLCLTTVPDPTQLTTTPLLRASRSHSSPGGHRHSLGSFSASFIIDKIAIYVKCTTWFEMHIHCERIPSIELINTIIILFLWEHKFYSLRKFQLYNTVLPTSYQVIHHIFRSYYLLTENLYPFTSLSLVLPPSNNHFSILLLWVRHFFFFFESLSLFFHHHYPHRLALSPA